MENVCTDPETFSQAVSVPAVSLTWQLADFNVFAVYRWRLSWLSVLWFSYGCLRQAAGWGWLQGLTATPAIVQLGETGPSNMAVCQAWLLLLHVC